MNDDVVTHSSAAVRTVLAITDAFDKGNARLLAAHYTFDAHIEAPEGDGFGVIVGRDALERDHAAFFSRHKSVEGHLGLIVDATSTVAFEWLTVVDGFAMLVLTVLDLDGSAHVTHDTTYFGRSFDAAHLIVEPWRPRIAQASAGQPSVLVKSFYEAIERHDIAGLDACLSDGFTWTEADGSKLTSSSMMKVVMPIKVAFKTLISASVVLSQADWLVNGVQFRRVDVLNTYEGKITRVESYGNPAQGTLFKSF